MKAAAAVLVGSLLFFVGVLTGAGRREAVPAPAAISLGATGPVHPAGSSPAGVPAPKPTASTPSPSAGRGPTATTAPGREAGPGSTPVTSAPVTSPPAAPGNPATATTAPVASTPGATAPPAATSTSSTTGPGNVQQVDNQVDCTRPGKGRGRRAPCPSTTSSTASTASTTNGARGRTGR